LHGFFTVLSRCHTVLTVVHPEAGEISYKAQSPDEGALVQVTGDVGYQFVEQDRETLLFLTPGPTEVEKYEHFGVCEDVVPINVVGQGSG
jgi:phospholipid-translocating ATPase